MSPVEELRSEHRSAAAPSPLSSGEDSTASGRADLADEAGRNAWGEYSLDSPEELRHRRLVTAGGFVLVVALVALLMPNPFHGDVWSEVADLLHIPAFGLINYLALSIARYHSASRWAVPLGVTFAVILFGGVIEILQGMLARHASWNDFIRNGCGATAALLFHQSRAAGEPERRKGYRFSAGLTAALAAAGPLIRLAQIAFHAGGR